MIRALDYKLIAQLDDLCIYHWLLVLIIQLRDGYSNVLLDFDHEPLAQYRCTSRPQLDTQGAVHHWTTGCTKALRCTSLSDHWMHSA